MKHCRPSKRAATKWSKLGSSQFSQSGIVSSRPAESPFLYFMEAHMITSKELSNKPIISITDGKKLGEVKDLYLDQDMRQVAAIFLGKEGLINDAGDCSQCRASLWH
jgi:hypothetical protein